MKAWVVKHKDAQGATIVFAETSGKARVAALQTDSFSDCYFTEILARRCPEADKMNKGQKELDWYCPEARLFLVKELGFRCEYLELDDCEECNARDYCDLYQDYLEEEER